MNVYLAGSHKDRLPMKTGTAWRWKGGAVVVGVLLLMAAACQPAPNVPSLPTLTLIPVTASPPPTDPPPTATAAPTAPDTALMASTLLAATPTVPDFSTDNSLLDAGLSPVAAELVQIAQRQVASTLSLPVRRVRLVDIQPYRWTDTSLGCPLPDQTYVPAEADGYRIVLAVGDSAYYFHTDFDRVIPCDIGFERLPDGTPAPTIAPMPTVQQVG